VNLKSIFFGVKYVVPIMRKQGGGSILNNGVDQRFDGSDADSGLCCHQGRAVVMLTKSLALD